MARSHTALGADASDERELAVLVGSLALVPLTFGAISYLVAHDVPGGALLVVGTGVLLPLLAARRGLRFTRSWLLATSVAGGYVLYGMEHGGTGRGFSTALVPTLVLAAVGIGAVLAATGHVLGWYSTDLQRYVRSGASSRD